jgi:hypothetical protein
MMLTPLNMKLRQRVGKRRVHGRDLLIRKFLAKTCFRPLTATGRDVNRGRGIKLGGQPGRT